MSTDLQRAAEAHFERGNALDEKGERERAIEEWQQAVQLDPDHSAAHYNLAIAFTDAGQPDLAIEEFRQAIRLDPFDTEARRELAELFLDQDRLDDAISQLRQALRIMPGDGETAHRLAEVYLDNQMWDEAAGALEAGALAEQDADLWFELGQAYAEDNRLDDAVLAYRRTLVCQPEHADAIEALRRLHIPLDEPPAPEEDAQDAEEAEET